MKQDHTSAHTSINATKLPRVFNLATFSPGEIILDFGCGRYTDHIRATARRTGGRYLVTVYEGDRSGNGRETMPDCWQRNEKARAYLRFFPGAHIAHGIIMETF